MTTTRPRQYQNTPVDTKIVLSALWTTMLFVFAYVDIFGFFRADVVEGALDGTVGSTSLEVGQGFLVATLVYILLPSLMVALSLLLAPRVNRSANLVVSVLYATSIALLCVGEEWAYYLLGSLVEVCLLVTIARVAWTWPLVARTPAEPPASSLQRSGGLRLGRRADRDDGAGLH